ncbi:P-type conjugative transfer protein TrbG [Sphingomonas qomolangmaensis]|uniref:P-type conjugative transfer protein TrbG n=1 Tax=Sphingomonas qomolangmaensis TaxID=2918765 RepID=A0ABY5L617_9SPHN|nr:P-type conjugative transfer protein TrbG [Sphingomonas qomolangmaensis]UUL82404.1 P-type conjugative transfer protein TrbG [Sphingomonas qomolangmaensis]
MNCLFVMPAWSVAAVLTVAAAPPQRVVTNATAPRAAVSEPLKRVSSRRDPAATRAANARPVTAVASANRTATIEPAAQGFVNAVQVFPYAAGLVFQVYTAPGHVTDIALQPGEALVSVASGDTVRWVIGDTTSGAGADRRTHILVKPFAAGLATNLVITTDRRSYHLALASTAKTAMAALSWSYPDDALIALKRVHTEAAVRAPTTTGVELEQLHFGYAIAGDKPAWRPLRVFDDGRQTFIEFPASLAGGEAPPLFLVDRKGEAQLVNYRLKGRFYIVDRLFDAAELRLGTQHQDVVRISRIQTNANRRGA